MMKSVSMIEMQECRLGDLYDFGRGIVATMNIIIIEQRSITPIDRITFAGLINVRTSSGILISPTAICTKTNSCQTINAFNKETDSLLVIGLLPLNAMASPTISSVSNAIGKMTVLVITMPST